MPPQKTAKPALKLKQKMHFFPAGMLLLFFVLVHCRFSSLFRNNREFKRAALPSGFCGFLLVFCSRFPSKISRKNRIQTDEKQKKAFLQTYAETPCTTDPIARTNHQQQSSRFDSILLSEKGRTNAKKRLLFLKFDYTDPVKLSYPSSPCPSPLQKVCQTS